MPTLEVPSNAAGRNLASVPTLARLYNNAFTESQVRSWIHNREQNGLAECVVKPNSRRLYIDLDLFELWLQKRSRELAPRVDSKSRDPTAGLPVGLV